MPGLWGLWLAQTVHSYPSWSISVQQAAAQFFFKSGGRATWNGTVVAESDATVVVEGNHYFPPEAVRRKHLEPSEQRSTCPWKGTASYYDIVADGDWNAAAWYYPGPTEAAAAIAGHVAFWRGVTVEAVRDLANPRRQHGARR